mmetsp:Transcript_19864/g.29524  ORF Transcript_19864/g.29524 Transcript_19864/m.29524 type:complete len:122 (-) Transcript_19864:198-563(-)
MNTTANNSSFSFTAPTNLKARAEVQSDDEESDVATAQNTTCDFSDDDDDSSSSNCDEFERDRGAKRVCADIKESSSSSEGGDEVTAVLDDLLEMFVEKNGRAPTEEEVKEWIKVFQSLSMN